MATLLLPAFHQVSSGLATSPPGSVSIGGRFVTSAGNGLTTIKLLVNGTQGLGPDTDSQRPDISLGHNLSRLTMVGTSEGPSRGASERVGSRLLTPFTHASWHQGKFSRILSPARA